MKRVPIQIRVPIISDKQDCCPYEKPFGYVYMIVNKVTGHYYIGKHKFNHPWLDKSYRGSGKALHDAYNSKNYSFEDFETSVLEWAHNSEELNNLEIYWIDMFGAYEFPFHYNLTPGGDEVPIEFLLGENNPNYGGKYTPSGKDSFMYGKRHTEETRKKMSENHADTSGKNNPMYGVHITGKNNHMYGKKLSYETKCKISESLKGRTVSDETKIRLSESHKGIKHSIQSRKKMSENHADVSGKNNPKSKSVDQFDISGNLIRHYGYLKEVSQYGFNYSLVSKCCKGLSKQYKGFVWKFSE